MLKSINQKYVKLLLILMMPIVFLVVSCWQLKLQSSTENQKLSQEQAHECRVVTHDMGESCVPIQPQRVIVLDTSALDAALFLGIRPIGSDSLNDLGYFSYSDEDLSGIELVGDSCQPSIEKILSLNPDLIIAYLCRDESKDETYQRLSRIAPVVNVSRSC